MLIIWMTCESVGERAVPLGVVTRIRHVPTTNASARMLVSLTNVKVTGVRPRATAVAPVNPDPEIKIVDPRFAVALTLEITGAVPAATLTPGPAPLIPMLGPLPGLAICMFTANTTKVTVVAVPVSMR